MYACMFLDATIQKLQVIMIHIKIDTIQYNINFKAKNVKRKARTPLITVAGIALKGQADLISIMVPLEVALKHNA